MDEEALQERWAINEKFIGQVVQSLVGLKNDKNNKKSKGNSFLRLSLLCY